MVNDKKPVREDGLRLHGKGISKGSLTYTAAFYPCLNVADPDDEEEEEDKENGVPKASLERSPTSATGRESLDSAPDEVKNGQPRSATAGKFKANFDKEPKTPVDKSAPAKLRASLDIGKDTSSSASTGRPSVESRKGPPKLRLSPEELLKYESGLLIFRFLEAEMPESHSRLEVFVDDMLYPSYVSATAQTRTHKFDEIGDCFIRELDFSRLTVKARKKGDDDDHTLASLTGNTLETLKQCLVSESTV